MPVEVMARRGQDTLRYGPLKPRGLKDPRTGREPFAVVQLRRDNAAGSIRRESAGGVLVSLAAEDLQEAHRALQGAWGVEELSEIKRVKDLALESFFFTGPEGYRFEVERFTSGGLRELF